MPNFLEKILFYTVGAVVGYVAGYFLLHAEMLSLTDEQSPFILAICVFNGIIISIIINEYREKKMTKANNAIREETVALITHEMKTSLTTTGWVIQLILQDYHQVISEKDKNTLQGALDSIHTSVMHSVNLLDISLLEIGKLKISLQWTTLAKAEEMFKEIAEKFTFGAKQNGIELSSTIKLDHEREAEIDMMRLRIIIENLLENAITYSDVGKKKIDLFIENDKEKLIVKVSDSGIGIPKEEQSKIFSEFYRASNARKKIGSGSGIGLYMCKQYVLAHHGTIRFESKENEGTTFYVTLPLKTSADVNEFLEKI